MIMSNRKNELDLKRWVKKSYVGFVQAYEPRFGSSSGIPDLCILVEDKFIPVELKYMDKVRGEWQVREFRIAQRKWHKEFYEAGGVSWVLAGSMVRGGPEVLWLTRWPKIDVWENLPVDVDDFNMVIKNALLGFTM